MPDGDDDVLLVRMRALVAEAIFALDAKGLETVKRALNKALRDQCGRALAEKERRTRAGAKSRKREEPRERSRAASP